MLQSGRARADDITSPICNLGYHALAFLQVLRYFHALVVSTYVRFPWPDRNQRLPETAALVTTFCVPTRNEHPWLFLLLCKRSS
jgi:hypothetical protein